MLYLPRLTGPGERAVKNAKAIIARHEEALDLQNSNAKLRCGGCDKKFPIGSLVLHEAMNYIYDDWESYGESGAHWECECGCKNGLYDHPEVFKLKMKFKEVRKHYILQY